MEPTVQLSDQGLYIGADPASASARMDWEWQDDHTLVVTRTYTAPELRGQGVAARLMAALVELARERHYKIVPQCTYVRQVMDREPEAYADLRAEG